MSQDPIKLKIYTYLVRCAVERRTTYYEELAKAVGLPDSGNQLGAIMSPLLERIARMDIANGNATSPITCLVVRKSGPDEGIPGRGFWPLVHVDPDRSSRSIKQLFAEVMQHAVYARYRELDFG